MKAYFSIFFLLISYNTHAFDPVAFKDIYPDFKNYHSLLLNDLKTYFYSIQENSIIHSDKNEMRIYAIRKTNGTNLGTIQSRIIRQKSINQISERVVYSLENGNKFEYEIMRKGKSLTSTSAEDLLTLKFELNEEEEYKLIIPSLGIEVSYQKTQKQSDKSFFSIGFMEFNVKIETFVTEKESKRSYTYFFIGMTPSPQAHLIVRAIEGSNAWSGLQYQHSASSTGEITPKQFFGGLADGSGAFGEASKVVINYIQSLGFPTFE